MAKYILNYTKLGLNNMCCYLFRRNRWFSSISISRLKKKKILCVLRVSRERSERVVKKINSLTYSYSKAWTFRLAEGLRGKI
jgi:hypothetical protein